MFTPTKGKYLYAAAGALLGIGAPAGWLLIRGVAGNVPWISAEFERFNVLYAYMGIGTSIAFAAFGFLLGRHEDRLQAAADQVKKALEHTSRLAVTDGLTGVNNARFLHEQLSLEVDLAKRYQTTLTCLLLDIDDFKQVNDVHGHPFGDTVLISVAKTIERCLRQVDVSGRLGGEEFLVIMRHTEAQAGYRVAERIRDAVQRFPFSYGNANVRVTVSLGLASLPLGGTADKLALLKAADDALYRAKRMGKNRTIVHGETVAEITAQ